MNKTTIKITINAEFGSEFQEETTVQTISLMMEAIKVATEQHHKKNKITYKIEGVDNV